MSVKVRFGEWVLSLREDSRPQEVMVEVTTRCNFNCVYCFRRRMSGEGFSDMSVATFKRVVDGAVEAGVKKLSLTGWGEPLVHPKIIDFVEYAKQAGLEVLLSTNGYLLGDFLDDLLSLGIDEISISIDSLDPEVYKRIRIGGELNRVEETLLRIKRFKGGKISIKPTVRAQFMLTRLNVEEIPRLIRAAGPLGINQLIASNIIPISREIERNLACYSDPKCVKRLEELRHEISKHKFGGSIVLPNVTPKTERVCPFMEKYALFVRWDGLVAPCIHYAHSWTMFFHGVERRLEPVIFGDINSERLIDIWRKERYARFRAMVYFMNMPSCIDCPLEGYCVLTRSNEMDCWGNTPTCSHCPYSRGYTTCPL